MRFLNATIALMVLFLSLAIHIAGCNTNRPAAPTGSLPKPAKSEGELEVLELGPNARKNLNLIVKSMRSTDYWRTLTLPGVISDRPGVSDRGVTSPAVGVVTEIHAYPGDTVRPGQRLVTLRLFSEYLQATQTQLFKASQEAKLVQDQIDRLKDAANSGAISSLRLIEQRNELLRQQTVMQASRQELLNRGLNPEQIALVAEGHFISTVDVGAPRAQPHGSVLDGLVRTDDPVGQAEKQSHEVQANVESIAYELQSLHVELGQTVQAGDMLANLANHQLLYVVGHAFKRESGLLAQAVQRDASLRVEFAEDAAELWPTDVQQFHIRHLSNTIDANTRTFDFYVPLVNQARSYERDGKTFLLWRYRPGQRARIEVPVELMSNVFVLPSEAVTREGGNAYVYRQNGDLFSQISVHVVGEDRDHVIVANDRSITPGAYLAQNAAAALRRVLKSQAASGAKPGLHVHADGTVHAAH